jgi:hypothetical protein
MFQTAVVVGLTRREFKYESNAILTGQIGVNTIMLWPKQVQWQICKFLKAYFDLARQGIRFLSGKA